MPTAWLKVSLMESSELWYHRLKVRGVQYDIGGDSTVGDRVGMRTLLCWQGSIQGLSEEGCGGGGKMWHHGSWRVQERVT